MRPGFVRLIGCAILGVVAATGLVAQDSKPHWAFVAPVRPEVPANAGAPRSAVDTFVAHRLTGEGVQVSAQADRRTLIRRLSLDLLGLPPSVAEVEAFVNDAWGCFCGLSLSGAAGRKIQVPIDNTAATKHAP